MTDERDPRSSELADGLAATARRIAAAATAAGRDPAEIGLLVVTKYFPADDVVRLLRLGVREFGESREPEAGRKTAAVRARVDVDFAVDMIGRVQRKKAGGIARWARRVHSVDSLPLIEAFDGASARALEAGDRDRTLGLLLQVSLDGDPERGGLAPAELAPAAERVLASPDTLSLDGLMAMAPLGADPDEAMERLARIRADFLRRFPHAVELSAGMSGDLEAAIAHGSTCVRVGTAIMGTRPIVSL
ncbi:MULTISPECIES: YggS family pyridoxal phosphate-dependent enzyme [Gordonia]|uniref:Pyridoxal phosphate homeostasis protein n=2 Tax=Gordonia TaxID=2053 RepID=L7LIV8_9ACTN|nr:MULTISPECIES: YggS family pyridoxal phosphate-dependent enzyme [Gordonia]AUH68772.1 YggS family pyridoxal phosphate-dependent enzyme [Gordonia sp. YC-JH1]KJR09248.1 hypothetical protein UG54_05135 [Gordonia sihwensis]MBY4571373.1 YggS family pyridoxal phosphate enzyme [Gordonia sihwensis]GAC60017.1 hypothetical protein GSI01S_06_01740 [Gordonia sihwensis NBRC 108236]